MTKDNSNPITTNNINLTGFLTANWNAPTNVRTLITTRLFRSASNKNINLNLISLKTKDSRVKNSKIEDSRAEDLIVPRIVEPFGNFNLALHVNDNPKTVAANRAYLTTYLPQEPHWLQQTHSNNILNLDKLNIKINNTNNHKTKIPSYDASYTTTPRTVCAIMTADCLPILITNTSGTAVAAVHAGWRGLANEIISNTIHQLKTSPLNINTNDILVYIAPCICNQHFIVDNEVYLEFIKLNPENHQFFKLCDGHNNHNELHHNAMQHKIKYHCDLIGIAKLQLLNIGIIANNIFASNECTACNNQLFYSYRINHITGRFASLIWLE